MRRAFALANWKMSVTIPQSRAFVRDLSSLIEQHAGEVDVVICPPATALAAVAEAVQGTSIAVGAQDLCPEPDEAHTGAISGPLLADAGATWVMAGHWEVRRRLGEDDRAVNRKLLAAPQAGLQPILLLGEERQTSFDARRLSILLEACTNEQVAQMVFVYEPEGAIGQPRPVAPDHAAAGCRAIRRWLAEHRGSRLTDTVRIIYGGSVTPEHAAALLSDRDVDGLGASRRGRDPVAFAEIVRLVAASRHPKAV